MTLRREIVVGRPDYFAGFVPLGPQGQRRDPARKAVSFSSIHIHIVRDLCGLLRCGKENHAHHRTAGVCYEIDLVGSRHLQQLVDDLVQRRIGYRRILFRTRSPGIVIIGGKIGAGIAVCYKPLRL